MSKAILWASYAQARVNHAWTTGFDAPGHQTTMGMTLAMIWINDAGRNLLQLSK